MHFFFFFWSVKTLGKRGQKPHQSNLIYKSRVTICKELGGGGEEGLQIVLGTFPTKAGIPSHFTNLEMFTYKMWKHDAVSVSVRVWVWVIVSVCVCVCVCGQRGPLALVTMAADRSRARGRYYQALIFVVVMTSR